MSWHAGGVQFFVASTCERAVILLVSFFRWDVFPVDVSINQTYDVVIGLSVHVDLYLNFQVPLVRAVVGGSFVGRLPALFAPRCQAVVMDSVHGAMDDLRARPRFAFLPFFDDGGSCAIESFYSVW